jgi:fumarate hydratase subunit alpha
MRTVSQKQIRRAVADACQRAAVLLRPDVLSVLSRAYRHESNARSRRILKAIIENARIAKNEKLAICQDTGMPVVFIELGQDVRLEGSLNFSVNKGVADGYRKGYLRGSIVGDPLARRASGFSPAVIHVDIVPGSKMKITVMPKGFGCENKSQLKMFNPTAGTKQIKDFIVTVVKDAGADACPPYVVGVGIGGTADYASLLAKKALLRSVNKKNRNRGVAAIENELMRAVNKLGIGPMGLGGKATALAVNIETYPTHIAGLPVAVNLSCHALRSASVIL